MSATSSVLPAESVTPRSMMIFEFAHISGPVKIDQELHGCGVMPWMGLPDSRANFSRKKFARARECPLCGRAAAEYRSPLHSSR